MRKLFLILPVLLFAVACGGRRTAAPAVEEAAIRKMPPAPAAPGFVSDPQEASEYVLSHFWKAFLDTTVRWRCDSAYVMGVPRDDAESAVGMYVTLMETSVGRSFARAELGRFFSRVEAVEKADTATNAFEFFVEMMEKYLYDPNSPVRDEDLYAPFVSALAESPLDGDMRPVHAYAARMTALNAIGTPAADFTFVERNGRRRTLYSVKAEHTLLFFSNPGCHACQEIIDALQADPGIVQLVHSGALAVVNVYIDQEIDEWKAYASAYPAAWHSGYDPDYQIRKDVSYNVRAIPSLYLLDRDKNVLLKDAPQPAVMSYLSSLKSK